eukprot:sb/3477101/
MGLPSDWERPLILTLLPRTHNPVWKPILDQEEGIQGTGAEHQILLCPQRGEEEVSCYSHVMTVIVGLQLGAAAVLEFSRVGSDIQNKLFQNKLFQIINEILIDQYFIYYCY